MPFVKKYDFIEDFNRDGSVDLSIYTQNFLKSLPTMVRIQVEAIIATGAWELQGTKLVKIWIIEKSTVQSFVPLTSIPKFPEQPITNTAIADQLIGKNINYPTLMLESADSLPIESETSDETYTKPKQKRNKGRNMKGIEYEITDWEKFYKFVHPGGRIEFIPKDVREREMDELEWKHVKENTDLEPEPESVQVIPTQKPDTTKYDVINPMIMVLNSFEKEQFRIRLKYTYNHNEQVIEERLSKLMLSTDQEYVMNQKLDLLEWYEEDQKKRKEIENFDFFSDDKKEGTKKK